MWKVDTGNGVRYAQPTSDDPEDYRHVLCFECNPAYEQEENQWKETHPIPFADGMTKQDKVAAIRKWADASHNHMRDWIVATR